jgi:PII-like signaling protein
MEISGRAVRMRIYLGESDRLGHLPLYEALVKRARDEGLAGATVLKGVLGYGASDRIRTSKLMDLSGDMPLVVEIVDTADKIAAFRPVVAELMETCGKGGMVTLGDVEVIHYRPGRKHRG